MLSVSETTVYSRLYDLHRRCKAICLHCTFVALLQKTGSLQKSSIFVLPKAEVDIFYFVKYVTSLFLSKKTTRSFAVGVQKSSIFDGARFFDNLACVKGKTPGFESTRVQQTVQTAKTFLQN